MSRERFGFTALIGFARCLLGRGHRGSDADEPLEAAARRRPRDDHACSHGLVPLSLAYARQSWIIIACCAIGGLGIEVFSIPWFTAIQREIPARLQARISSLDFLVSYGMSPVGFALIPIAIEAAGARPVLTAAGLLVIGSALATLLVPGVTTFSEPRTKETAKCLGSMQRVSLGNAVGAKHSPAVNGACVAVEMLPR